VFREVDVVSIDFACTVFWESVCDPRVPGKSIEDVFRRINCFLEDLGYSVREYDSYSGLYWSLWREIRDRGPERELWHRYVLAHYLYRVGVNADHRLLDRVYRLFIDLRARLFTLPPLHRWVLEMLRGHGYRVVLTTATGAHDLVLRVLELNDATDLFDYVHSTQLTGILKTDPRFYMELADLLGIEPYRIVHIGDSLKYDIWPARRAGLKTIYYGWRDQCRAVDPQPCITSLYELLHLL